MSDHDMNDRTPTDLQRIGQWLAGDVRVSRKILVAGGIVLLILLGVALD